MAVINYHRMHYLFVCPYIKKIRAESDKVLLNSNPLLRCLSEIFGIKSRMWDENCFFYVDVMAAIETSRRSEID